MDAIIEAFVNAFAFGIGELIAGFLGIGIYVVGKAIHDFFDY